MQVKETLYLKNMLCSCCLRLLREHLEKIGLLIREIKLGEVSFSYESEMIDMEKITETINHLGFEIITGRNKILVEEIKKAVIELIHELNNTDSIIRKSDYLVEKLGMTYQTLSKTFSQNEPITLERYIILQKIEKIKEMIDSEEYTLSEIAYMMDYSSVQHLSQQFKQITNLTVSEYKKSDRSFRKPIDDLY